jgi:two-component system KDP operon response regulator KdpE
LLSKVWGPEYIDDLQYLRVWISRLRSKLETDHAQPSVIKTLQGIGYLLDVEGRLSEEPAAESAAQN